MNRRSHRSCIKPHKRRGLHQSEGGELRNPQEESKGLVAPEKVKDRNELLIRSAKDVADRLDDWMSNKEIMAMLSTSKPRTALILKKALELRLVERKKVRENARFPSQNVDSFAKGSGFSTHRVYWKRVT